MTNRDPQSAPRPELSLFDSISIIMGIIIGSTLYQVEPDDRPQSCPQTRRGLLVYGRWAGCFRWWAALCYVELATAYPKRGRLRLSHPGLRSHDRVLFAWAQLWVFVLARSAPSPMSSPIRQ